jgi:hypothetical protein
MFEDSHNTLKYANRAKCMKIDPKVVRLREQAVAWPAREKAIRMQVSRRGGGEKGRGRERRSWFLDAPGSWGRRCMRPPS